MEKYKEQKEQIHEQRSREKMCLSKLAFKTKEEAFQKGQRVYQCKFCGKWHRSGQQAKFASELKKAGKPIRSGLKILSKTPGGYWNFVIIKPGSRKRKKSLKNTAET